MPFQDQRNKFDQIEFLLGINQQVELESFQLHLEEIQRLVPTKIGI